VKSNVQTPVVDIFAGPGGLSEGFSEFRRGGRSPFNTVLSIEKDPVACRTLRLRKFIRSFPCPPDEYHAFARGLISADDLYRAFPRQAATALEQTWQAELGVEKSGQVSRRVREALRDESAPWVLVGGPPCQAYSLAGRSRMRTTRPDFEQDERHFLYREYLQIVAKHRPAVFVMENVRGILTSTNGGAAIFDRIIRDLRRPAAALDLGENRRLEYRLYGLAPGAEGEFQDGQDPAEHFLIRSEDHGIPQARHRVFIIGVRSDIQGAPASLEKSASTVSVEGVLSDLPSLRSRLSRTPDSWVSWLDALRSIRHSDWMQGGRDSPFSKVASEASSALRRMSVELTTGAPFIDHRRTTVARRDLSEWYRRGATGLTLHQSRSHMKSDLHRYLFAASFAKAAGHSPTLHDFPAELRPRHKNVDRALIHGLFSDRFRVQCAEKPSSTVTSHISKDGHYFIHYAVEQCRSLTVREAARLQTFPDSYYFCGNRTQQYHQVGNAVPPLLAVQVAASVFGVLRGSARQP
jgi:DNA (cytosine-5)-methyltransferase 1